MVDVTLDDGFIDLVEEGFDLVESELSVIYPPGKNLSAKVRTLIDFLAARFGPEPPWGAWRKSEGQRKSARDSGEGR